MAKWVRALNRPAGVSEEWHLLDSDKDFVVAHSLCGQRLPIALEATSDDEKVERGGRCASCGEHFGARVGEQSAAVHRASS